MLERDAVVHCVEETHSDENIALRGPYPDAVETVREWHAAGHWIHVTSHRRPSTYEATAGWLEAIGMPFDDLHCSFDKVPRCVELGIHVLVDDSPVNITRAQAAGIVPATIVHPWNEEIVDRDGVIGARDWRGLKAQLDPCSSASRTELRALCNTRTFDARVEQDPTRSRAANGHLRRSCPRRTSNATCPASSLSGG